MVGGGCINDVCVIGYGDCFDCGCIRKVENGNICFGKGVVVGGWVFV